MELLRKLHLVEGRKNNLYISRGVSQELSEESRYIINKGFDDKYYRDLILDFLNTFGKGRKKDFRKLLWDKLPEVLTEDQKERKIKTLLEYLKRNELIKTGDNNYWILY